MEKIPLRDFIFLLPNIVVWCEEKIGENKRDKLGILYDVILSAAIINS